MVRFVKQKYMTEKALMDIMKNLEDRSNQNIQSMFMIEWKLFKWFRTDGGRVYLGKYLQEWLNNRSIAHVLVTACSPEPNEKAERFNRTPLGRSRLALIVAPRHVQDALWHEAVSHASYIRNHFQVVSNKHSRKPLETIHRRKTDISLLRTFRRKALVHVAKQNQGG